MEESRNRTKISHEPSVGISDPPKTLYIFLRGWNWLFSYCLDLLLIRHDLTFWGYISLKRNRVWREPTLLHKAFDKNFCRASLTVATWDLKSEEKIKISSRYTKRFRIKELSQNVVNKVLKNSCSISYWKASQYTHNFQQLELLEKFGE